MQRRACFEGFGRREERERESRMVDDLGKFLLMKALLVLGIERLELVMVLKFFSMKM